MGEGLHGAVELELSVLEVLPELSQELAPEQAAQDPDGKEEVGRRGDPPGSIRGQSPSGHDTVQVGMMREGLAPGMENSQEPDGGPEVAGVGRHLQQCPGRSLEQEPIDHLRVLEGHGGQELGQGEHDVEVGDGQEVRLLGLEPLGRLTALALGTVPVPAGVVGDLPLAAVVTLLDVAPQSAGPALDHGPQDPALSRGRRVALPVRLTVAANDLGDLQPRSLAHLLGEGKLRFWSRSNGLVVA